MSEAQDPLAIIRAVEMETGGMVIVRRVAAFPLEAGVELYNASGNLVPLRNHEGEMVELLNLKYLGQTITRVRNPSHALNLLALATALRREGVIGADYKIQCLAERPPPPGFKDPRAKGPQQNFG